MSISELKKLPIEIDRVVLPLETHYTTPGDLLYEPKTQVSIGQALTKFSSTSITLHSPINGIINNINNYPTLQSLGQLNSNLKIPSIEITKFDQDHNSIDKNNKNNKPHTDFLNTLNKYGIVGLGGAGFPTSNKLNSLINMIIVNCMECESPITSDNGLIINYSKNIISGLIILNNILKPKKIIIAIKKDMQLAITNLQEALSQFNFSNASNTSNNISIEIFDSNYGYPNGYSKSLIKLVTKQKIASHAHSSDHGIVCLNVATVYAIEQAINFNTPLIERVVTITGDLINNPGNYLLPIGTPIGTILNAFSVKYLNNLDINLNIKIGGDYMGYELFNSNNPIHLENRDYLNYIAIDKTTQAIQINSFSEHSTFKSYNPCIKCGFCEKICPMSLLPQQLYWFGQGCNKDNNNEILKKYNLSSCIECGLCDTVCPSNIPLASIFKNLKTELNYNNYKILNAKKAELRNYIHNKRKAQLAKQNSNINTNKRSLLLSALTSARNKKTNKK